MCRSFPFLTLLFMSVSIFFDQIGTAEEQKHEPTRTDSLGDSLPERARARLGTLRFFDGSSAFFRHDFAISADGKMAASGGTQLGRLKVHLWDVRTGKEKWVADQPSGVVESLVFSPDGQKLAAFLDSREVCVWDTATGRELARWHDQGIYPTRLEFSPDGARLVISKGNGTKGIYSWDWLNSKMLRQWQAPAGEVSREARNVRVCNSGAISPDERAIAWAFTRFKILDANSKLVEGDLLVLQDAATGKVRYQQELPIQEARNLQFSPDGTLIALGKHRLRLLEAASGKQIQESAHLPIPLIKVQWTADGKTLGLETAASAILWDAVTWKQRPSLEIHNRAQGTHRQTALSPGGTTLATLREETLRLWDAASGKEVPSLPGHRDPIYRLEYSADGRVLRTISAETLCEWDLSTTKESGRWTLKSEEKDKPFAVHLGQNVGLVRKGRTLEVSELTSGKVLRRFERGLENLQEGAISPDGKVLILATRQTALALAGAAKEENIAIALDLDTGKEIARFSQAHRGGYDAESFRFTLSPSGKYLAWRNEKGTVCLGEIATGKVAKELGEWLAPGTEQAIAYQYVIAFSPDELCLAIGPYMIGGQGNVRLDDRTIRVWDVATGRERQRLQVPPRESDGPGWEGGPAFIYIARPFALAISPDHRFVAFAQDPSGRVRLFEVASSQECCRLEGHMAPVLQLTFSPDGRMLASGGKDNTVILWDFMKHGKKSGWANRLTAQELTALWQDLAGQNAFLAHDALGLLIQAPTDSISFLREHLRPAPVANPKQIEQWIKDLGSPQFPVREKATLELAKLEEIAVPALKSALAKPDSLETERRLQQLLQKAQAFVPPAYRLRELRCLQALEYIGSEEAWRILSTLAGGAPEALLTREARVSLARLRK